MDIEDVKYYARFMYVKGRRDEHRAVLADLAAGELGTVHKRQSHEDHVRRRVLQMQACRAAMWPGRPEYLGGAVDWDTGAAVAG